MAFAELIGPSPLSRYRNHSSPTQTKFQPLHSNIINVMNLKETRNIIWYRTRCNYVIYDDNVQSPQEVMTKCPDGFRTPPHPCFNLHPKEKATKITGQNCHHFSGELYRRGIQSFTSEGQCTSCVPVSIEAQHTITNICPKWPYGYL